ncbi:MAG: chromate transporter [Lachnospiraceae bacterium]|nr:chromate transporter [Lachnospiraceae bacterium]
MLAELFLTFAKIGLFTFGGGYAMIAQIKEVVVEQKKWLDDEELMQIITVAESTPGPIAINMATYVGYKKKGIAGSAMATLGVVVPSLVILFTISLFLDAFLQNKYVAYAFTGIKCGVAFLILRAGLGLFQKIEKRAIPRITFGIVFVLMILFDLFAISFSSVWFILMGGVLGIALYAVFSPKKEGKE